ncbi:MAG TPA: hypothetical protein VNO30_42970 [Kofleriaceae bacterium]|nr:hypothetical protein [Kofleriaceae bacterium]
MLHPTLRELRALPPERPPRGLALVMGIVSALVLIAGTVALAVAAPPGPGPPGLHLRAQSYLGPCLGPAP